MRCAEVIRELAVPSDERYASALANHLSSCQACAAWAQHATRLEGIWKATKPQDPGAATWDAMWVEIANSLDTLPSLHEIDASEHAISVSDAGATRRSDMAPVQGVRKARVGGRSLVAIALIGLAQAAAILVAVGLGWQQRGVDPSAGPVSQNQASNTTVSVDIEAGRMVLIRSQGSECAVLDLTPDELVHGVDDFYVMFNALESMANNSIVAMKE
jgi:hypothetical protein